MNQKSKKTAKDKTNVGGYARSHRGITLLSLIITIVIMLILVGATIGITVNQEDLFGQAENTTKQYNNRIALEDEIVQDIINQAKEEIENDEPTPPQGSITLNKSNLALEILDGQNVEETLVATKNNIEGTITWSSSVPTVATVDEKGKVTTVGAGDTIITASAGSYSATCSVKVTTKTTPKVTLSASTGEVEVDSTLELTASLNVTAEENIIWTSSDDTIATVAGSGTNNATGTITGVKAGTVTITAKYKDKTATCEVTVIEKAQNIISFTIRNYGTFYAIEGWTWETWCSNTEYNTINAKCDDMGCVYFDDWCICGVTSSQAGVATEVIVSGKTYTAQPY